MTLLSLRVINKICLTPVVLVQRPTNSADVSLCLLRYASGIATMSSEGVFTTESFDEDGHRSLISSNTKFSTNESEVMTLREECLRLVCRISQKYCTVRKSQANITRPHETEENSCACCNTTSFLPENLIPEDDNSESDYSTDADSIFSQGSGSLYTPEEEDNDPDESDGFRPCAREGEDDSNDEQSIEECYSDFASQPITSPAQNETSSAERPDPVDNLICPGDFVEYRAIEANSPIKKSSIVSIESTNNLKYIVLTSGAVLHEKKHAVRKVKMYCSASQNLIPNPLAQWLCIDKCLLETGTLLPKDNSGDGASNKEDSDEEEPR